MTTPGLLAGIFRVNEENSLRALIPAGSTVAQVLIFFGSLFVIAVGGIAWAVAFRHHWQRRHRRRRSHHPRHKPAATQTPPPADGSRTRTLAQTGGLPPVRPEPPPPSTIGWKI
jgi:hypothetical protein